MRRLPRLLLVASYCFAQQTQRAACCCSCCCCCCCRWRLSSLATFVSSLWSEPLAHADHWASFRRSATCPVCTEDFLSLVAIELPQPPTSLFKPCFMKRDHRPSISLVKLNSVYFKVSPAAALAASKAGLLLSCCTLVASVTGVAWSRAGFCPNRCAHN